MKNGQKEGIGNVYGEREKGKIGKDKVWRLSVPAGKYLRLSENRAVSLFRLLFMQVLEILGN